MKLAIYAGLALALATTAAYADPFAGFYGNTLNIKDADGTASTVWVNADMTWEQHQPDGKISRGTWAMKDDTHFCIVVTEPAPKPGEQPATECHEMTGDHKVGDTWTMTDHDGNTSTMSLAGGRH
jgi:hypothetical protein